jgi:NDP-sugar pyrophosphorylase family protein
MSAAAVVTHAGIIAAGEGSRLAASHPGLVKPLVPVSGVPLCHWVARGLREAGATQITVLLNTRGRAVRESLSRAFPETRWDFLEADTASSWESFRLVSGALSKKTEGFVITTVDSLIPPSQTAFFAARAVECRAEAALALTGFVDDEKPLWADVAADGFVTALGPKARLKNRVTSGLYYMSAALAARMPEARAFDSLRGYWTSLVEGGVRVAGVNLSKTVDVDRPEDIREAEGFLKQESASW